MSNETYSVYYISLGCFKNLYDTEDISGLLTEAGFLPADIPSEADVIFLNTCTFIKDARDEGEEVIQEMLMI